MTRPVLYFLVGACTACSAAALVLGGYLLVAIVSLLLGAVWVTALILHRKWLVVLCVFGIHALAVLAILMRCPPPLAIASAFLALPAWDLSDFLARLHLAAADDDISRIEKRHFLVLFLVVLAGAGLLLFALLVRIPVTFEWTAVLILFGVWGLGKVIRRLLRGRE